MSLPLKAKVAIRDHWSSDDSPAAKAIVSLRATIGRDIICDPEWLMLLVELDSAYGDKNDLVVAVATAIQAWCRALTEVLDDEENEKWGEEMLEKLEEARSFALRIHVEVTKSTSPSTSWTPIRGGFILSLPSAKSPAATDFIPIYKAQLLNVFNTKPSVKAVPPINDEDDDDDDFTALDGETPIIIPGISSSAAAAAVSSSSSSSAPAGAQVLKDVEYLPNANSLPRPDELLSQPPYHMFIHARGPSVEIQCSHSPSLELLDRYLRKWCRTNNVRTNKPPLITIKLHQSPFGLGLVHDTLTLELENRYAGATNISPAMILNLVESLLGYKAVHSDMNHWQYRKDTPLKRL